MRLGPLARAVVAVAVAAFFLVGTFAARAERPSAPSEAPAAVSPPAAEPPPGPSEPLAGFAGERAFLRSPHNEVVLLPGVRVQLGGALFPRGEPKSGFFLRRARVALAGWLGPMFYFDVEGELAAGAALDATGAAADAYVAFAPEDDLFVLQAGQFDAPFTLENRTRDAFTPFIERSLAVRALGAPRNKDVGLMAHGADALRTFYYSLGVFNGDGPGLRNADSQVDFIGRAVVAPLAGSSLATVRGVSLGASAWYGHHLAGRPLPSQTTPGGFVVLDPRWTTGQALPVPLTLAERGAVVALAAELSVPLGHAFGLRAEGIFRKQDLAEDGTAADGSTSTLGRAKLSGVGGYGEAWVWLTGDDRQLPTPGLQLPARLGRVVEPAQDHGVVLAVRGDFIKEDLTSTQPALGDPNLATTRVVEASAGLTYWYGRRVRASMNYVLTIASGTSENVRDLVKNGREHELLLLLGMSL